MVHLVLHPHGIAPTFLRLDSWSPGADLYSYFIHQRNKSDKERQIVRKKLSFMHTKRFNTFFERWVQFRVGVIPRLPDYITIGSSVYENIIIDIPKCKIIMLLSNH